MSGKNFWPISSLFAEIKNVSLKKRLMLYNGVFGCHRKTCVTLFWLVNFLHDASYRSNQCMYSKKLHDAIHVGSTSILLINIEKCVKMSQTWPWQWPLVIQSNSYLHSSLSPSWGSFMPEKNGKLRPFRPWKMTFTAIQSNPALGSWLVPSLGRFMTK